MTAGWLSTLNAGVDDAALTVALGACCSSAQWVEQILQRRPYVDEEALLSASDAAIAALDAGGLADALAGHPRIGERATGTGEEWSRQEQSGVSSAAADVLAEIAAANAEYEQRFGHVYLVCASGRSAEELLAVCRSRLTNDPEMELQVVRDELAKITRIRLGKLLRPYDAP
jgi:2-oxo-4-hydroxy-4-carboxy-5-ureidoimidazoline decarboxylase